MLARFGIPQSHRVVHTPAGESAAIRTEYHAIDRSRMSDECNSTV